MAVLLENLEWADHPLIPETRNAALEAEAVRLMGVVPRCIKYIAASPWISRAYMDVVRTPGKSLRELDHQLIALVAAQENACRYCYGIARAQLRMFGFHEDLVEQIEKNARLAETDSRERALLQFCRDLSRSKPRPSRAAAIALEKVGFSPAQAVELVWNVAANAFANRLTTLLAVPPEIELEASVPRNGILKRLSSWVQGRGKPEVPPADYPPPDGDGAFFKVARILAGCPGGAVLDATLKSAFASRVLPDRTRLLMFAVVARTLECRLCEECAVDRLEAAGLDPKETNEVLTHLGSPALDEVESVVVPWARDTVWMPEQPALIQEKTKALAAAIGPTRLLEAIGIAALANACVRVAMLDT
jgi:uncharacterized peroxidase-related enzyme